MQAIGSLLLVIGLAIAAWQATVLNGKDIAIGRVTAIEPYGSSNRGGSTDRLIATFEDRSGATHTYRAAFGVTSTGYDVGDRIRIYFDPQNPADCGVASFGYRFGIAWGCILAGLALWLMVLGMSVGNRGVEAVFPATVAANERTEGR
jgi:hypothetical protein